MYKFYKKPSGYGKDSALTTAEKNALHLKLKKYCINQFKQSEKRTGKNMMGWDISVNVPSTFILDLDGLPQMRSESFTIVNQCKVEN